MHKWANFIFYYELEAVVYASLKGIEACRASLKDLDFKYYRKTLFLLLSQIFGHLAL